MDIATTSVVILAVMLGFFVQSIVGFAASLIAMPLLLQVMPLSHAVAIMSTLLLIAYLLMVRESWKDFDRKLILELGISSLFGLALGIYLLQYGSPSIMKKIFGLFIVGYITYFFFKHKRVAFFAKLGMFFGFLGGVFGGMFSSAGPVYVTYLNNKIEKAELMRANIIGAVALPSFLRVPMLIQQNIITVDLFIAAALVIPAMFVSYFFGQKIKDRICAHTFKNIVIGLLMVSGISLMVV